MQKTSIDWGIKQLYAWNPVTGCKRGCGITKENPRGWCYARRIHERFNKTPFSKIVEHPDRIINTNKRKRTIFVNSMSDIEYWSTIQKEKILHYILNFPNDTFMFLSKNPMAYIGTDWGYCWPPNTMQGLTMICTQMEYCQQEMIDEMSKYPRPFLSLEPLLGTLKIDLGKTFERVIVGAMTGPGATPVQQKWIDSVKANCEPSKLFWKDSIKNN